MYTTTDRNLQKRYLTDYSDQEHRFGELIHFRHQIKTFRIKIMEYIKKQQSKNTTPKPQRHNLHTSQNKKSTKISSEEHKTNLPIT